MAFSQDATFLTLDTDRKTGCIRSKENAYSKDGGLAVLYGNLAEKGCIVKTAGVDESQWVFTGRARCSRARMMRWKASWATRSSLAMSW